MTTPLSTPPSAQALIQLDNWHLGIQWSDGSTTKYHLGELQINCPCAACQGQKKEAIPEMRASRIRSVGRYGIQIDFTSGCRYGIYSYALLWTLGMDRKHTDRKHEG